MKIVKTFDPTATPTGGTFNAGFTSGNRRIVVYNESNMNISLTWDSFTTYCPAWTAMLYCITTSNGNINWAPISTLNMQNAPVSQVAVELYANSEIITGTFPASLVRTTQTGNSVEVQSALATGQVDVTGGVTFNVASGKAGQTGYIKKVEVSGDTPGTVKSGFVTITSPISGKTLWKTRLVVVTPTPLYWSQDWQPSGIATDISTAGGQNLFSVAVDNCNGGLQQNLNVLYYVLPQ